MLTSLHHPELTNREHFIANVLSNGGVSIVTGDDGWARVPLRQDPSRDVILLWSTPQEAVRWASVVAINPVVQHISLDELMGVTLPELAAHGAVVGADWNSDPTDLIVDASDLAIRLLRERTERFMTSVRSARTLWLLESASGPAMLPSARQEGREYLPVWSTREDAVHHTTGGWAVKRPVSVSLDLFTEAYLPFVERNGGFIGANPMPVSGTKEMTAAEFSMAAFPQRTLALLRAV